MDNRFVAFFFDLLGFVLSELIAIFAIFFFFGYILHVLQKRTQYHYQHGLGWRSIYLTAWIGTPIHEFSHLLFIKLFRHKVTEVSLFQPDPQTGKLGHVAHSYSNTSIYQQIGLFFIGAAPLLFGSFFLMLLTYLVVPNGKEIFSILSLSNQSVVLALENIWRATVTLFSMENLRQPAFWLFLYMAFSIAAHMAPSKQDRKNMYKGLLWIVLLLVIINIVPVLLGVSLVGLAERIASWLSVTFGFFFLAMILSAAHLVLSFFILYLPAKVIRRR